MFFCVGMKPLHSVPDVRVPSTVRLGDVPQKKVTTVTSQSCTLPLLLSVVVYNHVTECVCYYHVKLKCLSVT